MTLETFYRVGLGVVFSGLAAGYIIGVLGSVFTAGISPFCFVARVLFRIVKFHDEDKKGIFHS